MHNYKSIECILNSSDPRQLYRGWWIPFIFKLPGPGFVEHNARQIVRTCRCHLLHLNEFSLLKGLNRLLPHILKHVPLSWIWGNHRLKHSFSRLQLASMFAFRFDGWHWVSAFFGLVLLPWPLSINFYFVKGESGWVLVDRAIDAAFYWRNPHRVALGHLKRFKWYLWIVLLLHKSFSLWIVQF